MEEEYIELTKKQIERQDFVDNEIFELLQTLNPTDNTLDWDIEMIGNIREIVRHWFEAKFKDFDEQEFYPYIEE
jgi:hypothetical protein